MQRLLIEAPRGDGPSRRTADRTPGPFDDREDCIVAWIRRTIRAGRRTVKCSTLRVAMVPGSM